MSGEQITFGVHTGLQETGFDELIPLWQSVESWGYGWISVWDHIYPTLGEPSGQNLDAIVAMTALAQATERVRVGSLVFNATLRPPALIAKAIASIDQLSGGRAELGLGAGWFEQEQAESGIPYPPDATRVSMLEESVRAVRRLLTEERATFDGEYFRLDAAYCEPKPQQERLRIWVGAFRPRTLAIAGRLADGFNTTYLSPELWASAWARVREAAERAGRDPATVAAGVNLALFVDADEQRAARRCEETLGRQVMAMGGHLLGSTDQIVEKVAAYVGAGARWINVVMRAPFDPEGVEAFAREAIPEFS